MFPKLSFRQLLLGVFLLIAALLGATSVHALLTLDRLAAHSREAGRHAIALTENAQRLAERSVAMERSARQFLVLDDPAFRDRYADAWRDAQTVLQAIADGLPGTPPGAFVDWRKRGEAAWAVLETPRMKRAQRQQALNQALNGLPALSHLLEEEVKREVERRNQALLDELDQRRAILTSQVAMSIALAALLALSFGAWLSRPLKQIEQAIHRLGENQYGDAIDVYGPGDLRRLGRQLNWLRQRLFDLEADKSRFLRHISHELKTPLAALVEGVSLLEDQVLGALTPQQREIAAILRQNTASLQNQIEDLLRYNAANFEAQNLRRQPCDPAELLAGVVASQQLQMQARGVRAVVEGAARPPRLDRDKIAIAVSNLLSNAVRFSPPDGVVRFALSEHQRALRIDCVDQGPGVAPDDAARVFEPFYQGERQPPGARRGNGIGLSIVREYVVAHGGSLQLLPSEAGAHFRIELPYED
ncbi:HAMP domain-containing sensor histidine kinase [Pseudoduganella namucuonensis]|uniref:histidine kinase n=1 Tax=Pseudoduganella namucuonensis TaxID=1035707 RepID=A0A1I7IWQ1_9BURK|nr:HAMP domain-containing sensor histidine kinase [Pseudoduganella namucuonensis]SFU77353.1 two-component system, NtrC family, sensor histidine kinase GlrK [Pseudoduganella namucuonensis]